MQFISCAWRRGPSIAVLVVLIFAGMALAPHMALARQCTGWEQIAVNSPPARSGAAMVYIAGQNKTLLFGGASREGSFGDTWTWDGSEWTELQVAGPSPRYSANMAYDPIRHVVLLYGGHATGGRQTDTWEFNGTRWRLLSENGPDITNGTAMAFDPGLGRIILFDGRTGRSSVTYVWTDHYWLRIAIDGPSVNPYTLVTDIERGRVLLVALYYDHVIWEWSGGEWTLIDESEGPGDWYSFAVAYDASRHSVITTGGTHGEAINNETWEWGDSGWQRLVVDDQLARSWHNMVYDEARQRLVVFGGRDADFGYLGDTLEADADTFLSIMRQPGSREVIPGQDAGFSVNAIGSGPITYQWRKDGEPLTDDGHFTGTQTEALHISSVGPEDEGSYDVLVQRDCGELIGGPATLTLRVLPVLQTAGRCPGLVWLQLSGSRSNGRLMLFYGDNEGTTEGWFEVCGWITLGVAQPHLTIVGEFRAGEDGTLVLSGRPAPSRCGGYVQMYDFSQCLPSNVVQLP